jgi:DNA-binding protein HU-beta
MNKAQFNKYVRKVLVKHMRTSGEMEADSIINIFTESVLESLEEEDEVFLVGFGRFYKSHLAARNGRNPKTGESIKIPAHVLPKFSAGIKLKEACNKKNKKSSKK